MENRMEVPKETKTQLPHSLEISLLDQYPENIIPGIDTYTDINCSTIYSSLEMQTKMSIDRWTELWYIYGREFY